MRAFCALAAVAAAGSTPILDFIASQANATAAQVTIAWLWALGVPCNPRTMSPAHMADNLAAISAVGALTPAEMQALSSRPVDTCAVDSSFYECVESGTHKAPARPFVRRTAAA